MRNLLSLFILLLVVQCNPLKERPKIAFYYWKTTYELSTKETSFLKKLEVDKLYIRLFDVDIDSKTGLAVPVSPIKFAQNVEGFEMVPVIYLKNRLFLDHKLDLNELVNHIHQFISQIALKHHIQVNEVQFDCDWTLKSRDSFLRFIELYRAKSGIKLSATIRLHQVKYRLTTLIPKVDEGVLMYYNMGRIGADSLNSIYDRKIAKQYIGALKDYPLPLQVALPIYSWGVHSREGKVVNLVSKVHSNTFESDTNFVAFAASQFRAVRPTIKGGTYFKEGDVVKIEAITKEDLLEMATDLAHELPQPPKEIIFYDLDTTNLNIYQYDDQLFKEIISRF